MLTRLWVHVRGAKEKARAWESGIKGTSSVEVCGARVTGSA